MASSINDKLALPSSLLRWGPRGETSVPPAHPPQSCIGWSARAFCAEMEARNVLNLFVQRRNISSKRVKSRLREFLEQSQPNLRVPWRGQQSLCFQQTTCSRMSVSDSNTVGSTESQIFYLHVRFVKKIDKISGGLCFETTQTQRDVSSRKILGRTHALPKRTVPHWKRFCVPAPIRGR